MNTRYGTIRGVVSIRRCGGALASDNGRSVRDLSGPPSFRAAVTTVYWDRLWAGHALSSEASVSGNGTSLS